MRMNDVQVAPVLRAEGLHVRLGARVVLDNLSVGFEAGRITALCGPNGCGKSTLLRSLGGLIKPSAGRVWLDGRPLGEFAPRERAQRLAMLAQNPLVPEGMLVEELVATGRYCYTGIAARPGADDRDAVERAIERTHLHALRKRDLAELSGGERQRAFIAMALAQGGRVLLLDEPTTFLDIHHQVDVLKLIRDLAREMGLTVVWVLHDLNQAAAFSDEIMLMRDGAIRARGEPDAIMQPDVLEPVFETPMRRFTVDGEPVCLPRLGT
ncbi:MULTISPECIES: ABC transporter ATP-binding protein [Burkholderia]|uniref:ABC transporter n=1 Tax=Burkholderia paludis TaxID=1506587 RepID=A0A6P2IRG5_9BURK|nr:MULTISPECIES: ABC transporter ATP-binding protein [Burkholderia]CAB3754963.1 Fe(3+) dicitrate transport ATP-binding protein FecE [Burkholderia paludis]VWB33774.1 ABC transporter [Burkholderia paludis]